MPPEAEPQKAKRINGKPKAFRKDSGKAVMSRKAKNKTWRACYADDAETKQRTPALLTELLSLKLPNPSEFRVQSPAASWPPSTYSLSTLLQLEVLPLLGLA